MAKLNTEIRAVGQDTTITSIAGVAKGGSGLVIDNISASTLLITTVIQTSPLEKAAC